MKHAQLKAIAYQIWNAVMQGSDYNRAKYYYAAQVNNPRDWALLDQLFDQIEAEEDCS